MAASIDDVEVFPFVPLTSTTRRPLVNSLIARGRSASNTLPERVAPSPWRKMRLSSEMTRATMSAIGSGTTFVA